MRTRQKRALMVAVIVAATFAPVTRIRASGPNPTWSPFGPHVQLPADLEGELDGVPYRIRVPLDWNGTLLVYAHGYGETGVPLALTPVLADEETLLARGFALAASRFDNAVPMPGMLTEGGYQVKEGMQSTIALTSAFRDMVGHPRRTILWGKSMGGLITLGMIEKFANHFDGAIALCPTAAGSSRRWDQALDLALAYKVAFGWDDRWGTPGDLRDDLNVVTDVLPHILQQMVPAKKPLWEFVRRVNRIPLDSYYAYSGGNPGRLMSLYFAFQVRAELERRAGGAVSENIGRTYTLDADDKSYLTGLGVDADGLLAGMNAEAIYAADRNAREYVEHYVDPAGDIGRPVLTMHTRGDALATPNHEPAYRATVEQRGNLDLLLQVWTTGVAHCAFTSEQGLAAVDAMMSWLDTGQRPDPSVFFPPALGFDPAYVPRPWPW